jgi:nucleoside-diphosphate-sugar epimerase
VEWASVDLSTDDDRDALAAAVAGADAVVHLAWGFQPSHDLRYLEELGVGGTRRVLAAASAAGVRHVVHMSSVGAYSPKRDDAPVDESWPTQGVPTSQYSRHKAAAERLLDGFESTHPHVRVTRVRPGIVGQRAAGSALLRYGVPTIVPARALGFVPVLPLDRRLTMPVVHADDVADALVRIVDREATGAFNLAAEPPVTSALLAELLGARLVHVPSPAVRVAMSAAWHARLQPVDTGWLDMGFSVPLLDTSRAQRVLGWRPTHAADAVMREVLDGMRRREAGGTPVLRRRRVIDGLSRAVRQAPVTLRRRP